MEAFLLLEKKKKKKFWTKLGARGPGRAPSSVTFDVATMTSTDRERERGYFKGQRTVFRATFQQVPGEIVRCRVHMAAGP